MLNLIFHPTYLERQGERLPINFQQLQAAISSPPRPEELENLIMHIENSLEQHKPERIADNLLIRATPIYQSIAQLAFAQKNDQGLWLTTAQIELLYQRLAKVANGFPAKAEGLPESPEWAVALVFIREMMHHWQIKQCCVEG